jgi:fatty-acyl-CoA synthase
MQVADALWEHIKPAALRFRSTPGRTPQAPPDLLARFKSHAALAAFKPFLVLLSAGTVRQYSYADALQETRRWAQVLSQNGVQQGDRVFIALTHRPEIYFCFLGAIWIGAVPTIIPFPTPKQDPVIYWSEYRSMFAQVEPRALVTYAANIEPVTAALAGLPCAVIDVDAPAVAYAEAPASCEPLHADPDGIAVLQFSSGTTGLRKGVMLSHGQIARHMDAYARAIDFGARDTVASWLPLYHDMGLIACFLLPLHAGATIVALDAFEWVAKPWSLLEAIETYAARFAWLPNFAFHHIVRTLPDDRVFKLGGMRAFVDCSEICRPDTLEQFAGAMRAHGVRREQLQVSYGMAETVFAATQTQLGEPPRAVAVDRRLLETSRIVRVVDDAHGNNRQSFLSCGMIVGDLDVRIVPLDDTPGAMTEDADENHAGEIEVRGGHLFSGYFRNKAANEAASADGWYRTGDLGFVHEGELFVCGRKKEMLIVHGRNYYAHDIEAIVSGIAHVKPGRAVVFSVEDAGSGSEEAVVLLETEPSIPIDRRALQRAVKAAIFDRMELTVRSVVVVAPGSLVKTTSGKLSRAQNKARHLAGQIAEAT